MVGMVGMTNQVVALFSVGAPIFPCVASMTNAKASRLPNRNQTDMHIFQKPHEPHECYLH